MDTFLKQVARRVLDEHPADADRTLVVFNNHRSELFLRRAFEHLSAECGNTFFLPQMTTIDELVADLGGLRIVPNEFLLFELYRIHMEIGGDGRKYQTFEEFMSFGDVMLSDFSEVDRYCVDARDLFVNLHDLKAIGEWDIENPAMSPFQRQYLEFYHSLYDYYCKLREHLLARGEAYGGMAYRQVADNIAAMVDGCSYSYVYFVGFNALSECERRIIGEYVRRGKGCLLTDGDPYYYADPMQEAGHFLRKHSAEFPTIELRGTSLFGQGKKRITIVECPEAVLQCKFAGQMLSEHTDWLSDSESTAIVLADESLLMPTLGALPDSGQDYGVNISMGFSYADSGVHMLVQRLLALYRQARPSGYYHTTVVDLLSDYHIGHLLGQKNLRQRSADFMERENRIRCSGAEVAQLLGTDRLAFLFPDALPSPDEVIALVRQVATLMVREGTTESNKREKQALGGLVEILDYLAKLQSDYHFITTLATLEKIYQRLATRHTIAFLGQPLSGLQILGVLETRNLDFRRVVLLSANEGVLPAGRSQSTLIPYELQRVFHLPTYDEKDSVYAYNFYRLLQRADEVYLCFSSEAESMGKGEESRFVKQVRSELARRFPANIEVSDMVVDLDTALVRNTPPVEGPKSDQVMERLRQLARRGLSPTSLNNYIECPMRYYYCNVLDIDEPEPMEEDLDASQLGTCVHQVLQRIYTPYIGRAVDPAGLKAALANLPQLMQEAFADLYRHGRTTEGRNQFLYSVGESQLRHVLQKELAVVEGGTRLEIVALEQELTMPLAEGVVLKGFVDRIDRVDGRLRIVDYKTGRLDDREITLGSDDFDAGHIPGKWLQLLCYALLYVRNTPSLADASLQAGIYPLRNLRADVRLARWDGSARITRPQLDLFEQRLGQLTAELLDPAQPFLPPERPQGCSYCPVRGFCPSRL